VVSNRPPVSSYSSDEKDVAKSEENGYNTVGSLDPAKKVVPRMQYSTLMSNPRFRELYEKGKKGDYLSSAKLIKILITDEYVRELKENFGNNFIIIPVMGAQEVSKNVNPIQFVKYLKQCYGIGYYNGIYKVSLNRMKEKSLGERLNENIQYSFNEGFSAEDIRGKSFVIADDNISSGSTTLALAEFIVNEGGNVIGFTALTRGQDSDKYYTLSILKETENTLIRLGKEFGYNEEFIREQISWLSEKRAAAYALQPEGWKTFLDRRRASGSKQSMQRNGRGSRSSLEGAVRGESGEAGKEGFSDSLSSGVKKSKQKTTPVTDETVAAKKETAANTEEDLTYTESVKKNQGESRKALFEKFSVPVNARAEVSSLLMSAYSTIDRGGSVSERVKKVIYDTLVENSVVIDDSRRRENEEFIEYFKGRTLRADDGILSEFSEDSGDVHFLSPKIFLAHTI